LKEKEASFTSPPLSALLSLFSSLFSLREEGEEDRAEKESLLTINE